MRLEGRATSQVRSFVSAVVYGPLLGEWLPLFDFGPQTNCF